MRYLGQVTIVGPESEPGRRQYFIDALGAAMAQGWRSPIAVALSADDAVDSEPDRYLSERVVLEHRIFGFPGGAAVAVVLDGDDLDFEEAATALASLGRHLTTWSPELLKYTLRQVDISTLEQRWDDNWLPPVDRYSADDRPTRPLTALMGEPLRQLAAQYFVAGAVRSIWEPGKRVNDPAFTARDVALGAFDHVWRDEIMTALGAMLIQAARLERAEDQGSGHLFVADGGSRAATDDLVRRARLTANDDQTQGFTDDQMRGHLLLEAFTKANQLDWTADGDRPDRREARRNELLRQVLKAGFGAVATMCFAVRDVRSAWELSAKLTEEPVVAAVADLASDRIDQDIQRDAGEVWAAAVSHAAVWAAIHRPDLLDTTVGMELLDNLTDNLDTLHQVVFSALVLLGPATITAALDDPTLSASVTIPMRDFVTAQRLFQATGYNGDALDDMHHALGAAFEPGNEDSEHLRHVLRLITVATSPTAAEANADTGQKRFAVSRSELSTTLLRHADHHAAIALSQESHGDGGVRMATLAVLATLAPDAAGAMAPQLPILDDEDPRGAPAARDQALRWIHNAAESADNPTYETASRPEGSDARLLLASIRDNSFAPNRWTTRRLVAAAAEAAAFLIQPASLEDAARAITVFEGSRPPTPGPAI